MSTPATRTAAIGEDIATCPRCDGIGWKWSVTSAGGLSWHRHDPCLACLGTGQRHTVADCTECGVSLLVPWSVDHTLAPLRCDSCAAVCNETAARVAAGRK